MSEVKLCNPENFRLGANPFLAGSLRCDPPAQSHFTRKSAITEYYVSGSPSTPNGPLTPRKNVLTAKKGPFFGGCGRKTGVWGREKNTLFCTFSCFGVGLRFKVVVSQKLAENLRLQKKSCRKTYHRFLIFCGFW